MQGPPIRDDFVDGVRRITWPWLKFLLELRRGADSAEDARRLAAASDDVNRGADVDAALGAGIAGQARPESELGQVRDALDSVERLALAEGAPGFFRDDLYALERLAQAAPASPFSDSHSLEAFLHSLTLQRPGNNIVFLEGTHAARAAILATAYDAGSLYHETDRGVLYVAALVSGANEWVYAAGTMIDALANRPGDLGTNDAGFRFFATDASQLTVYLWRGTLWTTVGGLREEVADAVTNAASDTAVEVHSTSGTAAVGFAARHLTRLENAAGSEVDAAAVSVVWTNAGAGAETSDWVLYIRSAGAALAEVLRAVGGGNLLAAVDVSVPDEVYGAGWNGSVEVPTKNAVYDKIEALNLASGVYTPTLTNVANVAASTAYECQYLRVGSTVTVSGRVDVDPTAAASTQLGISLPIASNLGAVEDCAGTAFAPAIAGQGAAILGDAANNRAQMEWIAVDLTNQAMYFTFSYQVI